MISSSNLEPHVMPRQKANIDSQSNLVLMVVDISEISA